MTGWTIPDALVAQVRRARHIVVLTGAGVSAESGIPTFRDAQTGLWAQYDPTELASPAAFRRHPQRVWQWYQWRRALIADKRPNPGHTALAQMAALAPRLTLVTQNIDGLHQAAGSAAPIELHGNIARLKCFSHGHPFTDAAAATGDAPPRCPRCGSLVRHDVVWFGEMLAETNLRAALAAAESADLFFSVGTSSVVYPAAHLPVVALQNGALFVEINPEPTPLTRHADYALAGPSGVVLPALVAAVWGE